ncbi:DUF1414 domain-containing protein [Vibrio sp. AK197]|uniref:UPF0352 protein ACFFUV_01730 n=1 Tax=Vibrio olivae TaxID=1243002 RepID=A0ABV5HHJ3_9VIBR
MPITSKYSNEQIETILSEVGTIFQKHQAAPDLMLMIAGNIATNVVNQHVAESQRKKIAEQFAQALLASVEEK